MSGEDVKGQQAREQRDDTSPAKPTLRADARRNREKLVDVAAEAFSQFGVDTSLEAIARQAGVGIGTLYRHFPTREALIEAVYRHEVEALVACAEHLMAEKTPEAALAEWMQRYVGYMATKRGMRDNLKAMMESKSQLFAETHGLVPRTFTRMMENAQASGAIRADAESGDVLHALSSIYSYSDGPDFKARAHRLVGLLMDGLRYGAPE
nr:TetR/AcrR family transcriptional regulator [Rhizobium halophytocola]